MTENQNGLGLIEVMIGVVLLCVAAVVVAMLSSQSRVSSGTTTASTGCTARAEEVISVFKGADNKLQMENFHASAAQPLPTAPYPHLERFSFPLANPTPGNSLAPQNTNGWELINSGSNWALALYNVTAPGVNFCTTPFAASSSNRIFPGAAPAGFSAWGPPNPLYPQGTPLKNESIFLNIQRKDFSTGTLSCSNQGRQRLVPLSPSNSTDTDSTLGNNVGLQVSATVQYTDSLGNPNQCTRSTLLKPDGDSTAPFFVAVPVDIMPGGLCPPATCTCFANDLCIFNGAPGMYEPGTPSTFCGNPKVSVTAASSEPGTVFACELDYSPTNPPRSLPLPFFLPCTSFTVGGASGKISAIHLGADFTTAVKIDLTGLTNLGYYSLFVEAMDSAQNPNTQIVQFRYKATCP